MKCTHYLKATRLNVDGGMRFAFPPYVGKPRLQIGRVVNGL